jgi:hypothetical protein
MRKLFVILSLSLTFSAVAEIIPDDRRVTWNGAVGIPGGIPTNFTIYTNMGANATRAQIQTALDNATNKSYVLLPAGTNVITGVGLAIKTNTVLRGAGTNTVLILDSAIGDDQGWVFFNANHAKNDWSSTPASTAVTANTAKGDTNITVASNAGITANQTYLVINQLNNGGLVNNYGDDGNGNIVTNSNAYGDDGWGPQNRNIGQVLKVTSVNGTTIGFEPPLYFGYTTAYSPLVYPYDMSVTNAGLESVCLRSTNSGGNIFNVAFCRAAYCWMKDVESDFAQGDHVWLTWSYRCEIRSCFFHDGFIHGPGTTDNTLKIGFKTTACLTEDNIFWRLHTSVMLNWGCAGNVLAYNYSTNNYHTLGGFTNWCIPDWSFHAAHPYGNLSEGNVAVQYHPDSLHGTSSHNVAFRNWWAGSDYYQGPADKRYTSFLANENYWESNNSGAIFLDYPVQTNSVIGNILGSSYQTNSSLHPGETATYSHIAPDGGNPQVTSFMIGYDGDRNSQSNSTINSSLIHGNWSIITSTQQWDSAISDHSLPNSYYLDTKPAYFGVLAWPPIDPANPATASATNIPAGYRFVFGSNPPAASGGSDGTVRQTINIRILNKR